MSDGRNWVEIVLMPLAVAVVGTLGTYFITTQQQKSAELKAAEDRQIKILEIFAENITSKDEGERIFALRLLEAVDDELAARLARAVSDTEQKPSPVREVANQVAQSAVARASQIPRVYIHIRSDENRESATGVASRLQERGYVVPGIERLSDQGPDKNQLRFFRRSEESTAKAIAQSLQKTGVTVQLQYIEGYEDSSVIKPQHFELWFAPGQP